MHTTGTAHVQVWSTLANWSSPDSSRNATVGMLDNALVGKEGQLSLLVNFSYDVAFGSEAGETQDGTSAGFVSVQVSKLYE